MNSGIQVFSNQEFSVRTMRDADGTLWFVAKDVAQALEYSEASNPARLFQSVPEIWRGVKRIHTLGGEQEMSYPVFMRLAVTALRMSRRSIR